MRSNQLSKSETTQTVKEISSQWNIDFSRVKTLTIHAVEDEIGIITGDGLVAIKFGQTYLPFLSETSLLERFPKVVVDSGAIKFVCNGANIMRPGIKKYTSFEKDQVVCVVEEIHNKFLAVGKSIVSSDEITSMAKGEVIKNLHYISDKFWEAAKQIKK